MLEPDALGCLLHGAKGLLLVGDHHQLPPFTKWQGAARERYNVSLMERLVGGSGPAKVPMFMLCEQYRMHAAIGRLVSDTFYRGRLLTAPVTAAAR
eukprot:398723-Prorocentrum_minimum.AAC.1